jgi:hypothetical protein
VIGVGIGIGTLSSGFIVDVMAKRSRVWYALTPLIAMAAAIPFWYLYTQAQDWTIALGTLILPLLFNIFYLAPGIASGEQLGEAVAAHDVERHPPDGSQLHRPRRRTDASASFDLFREPESRGGDGGSLAPKACAMCCSG